MNYVYIPYTVQAWKDDVCLFETDCELKVSYDLPDGRSGVIDWDVTGFYFTDANNGVKSYTEIHAHEPLFHVLKKDLDLEFIDTALRETLADHGEVDLYRSAANA
jgi:hypothetical protein